MHAKAHKHALGIAYNDAEQRDRDRFLESKDNATRVNRSTSAAAALIKLPAGKRGADIANALSRQHSPLSGIAGIGDVEAHTRPNLLEKVLQDALTTDAPLKALIDTTLHLANGKEVHSCTNVQRNNRRDLAPALDTVKDLLRTATTKAACAPTATPMAWLKYHGAADPARPAQGVATAHRNQSGHAELMASAPFLAELMSALGEAWRVYTPGPPATAMCLVIVVSRNCCSSCRYALPHIARLLKIDIVAYFRTRDGRLSSPVLAAWDVEPPAAQLAFVA